MRKMDNEQGKDNETSDRKKIQLPDQSVLFQLVHYIYGHYRKTGDTSICGGPSA